MHLRSALVRTPTVLFTALAGSAASADTLYWNAEYVAGSPASWNEAANWSTDAEGTTPASALPTLLDDVIFNSTPYGNDANQTRISVDIAARSLTFDTTSTVRLSQTNSTRILSLGEGGITVNSEASGITIGESTGSLFTEVTASQTWANNSNSGLSVRRLRVSNTATGDVTVTLSANGSGSISFANSIADSVDGTKRLGIVIDSAGTGTVSLQAASSGNVTSGGSWTGGTLVKRGTLLAGTATVGIGDIKLGDTSGDGNATLRVNTTTAFTTDLVVQAGNTGVSSLEFVVNGSATYAGNITLEDDLHVGVRNAGGGSSITGVISGSGNLIKGQYQGSNTTGMLTLRGVNTFSGDLVVNVGSLTLAEEGALTFYLGADGASNQVRGAGSNSVTFAGGFIFDFTNVSLTEDGMWQIVDVDSLNESFTSTFFIQGFTEIDNVWTNGLGFSFSEATGVLTYTAGLIPEPSAFAAFAGLGALGASALRRRRRAAA